MPQWQSLHFRNYSWFAPSAAWQQHRRPKRSHTHHAGDMIFCYR
jgi:hypothetical protein